MASITPRSRRTVSDFVYWPPEPEPQHSSRDWLLNDRRGNDEEAKLLTSKYGATFLDLGIELEKRPRAGVESCRRTCMLHTAKPTKSRCQMNVC